MSKQLRLTSFYNVKENNNNTKPNKKNKHHSSREGSDATEKLGGSDDDIPLEVFQGHRLVGPSFLLLTPTVMLYFAPMQRKLKGLGQSYSKQNVMDFILHNLKFHKIDNLHNLDLIKDDDFWDIELPATI